MQGAIIVTFGGANNMTFFQAIPEWESRVVLTYIDWLATVIHLPSNVEGDLNMSVLSNDYWYS